MTGGSKSGTYNRLGTGVSEQIPSQDRLPTSDRIRPPTEVSWLSRLRNRLWADAGNHRRLQWWVAWRCTGDYRGNLFAGNKTERADFGNIERVVSRLVMAPSQRHVTSVTRLEIDRRFTISGKIDNGSQRFRISQIAGILGQFCQQINVNVALSHFASDTDPV